jgi:hypothetical protein
MAMASAMAFGDIIGGDVGALEVGKMNSGNAIDEGSEDDRGGIDIMPSGEVCMPIFV